MAEQKTVKWRMSEYEYIESHRDQADNLFIMHTPTYLFTNNVCYLQKRWSNYFSYP